MTIEKDKEMNRTARLTAFVEDALFEIDDASLLTNPGMREISSAARAVVEAAVCAARSNGLPDSIRLRRTGRRPARRPAVQRTVMRELLVANPRARHIVGEDGIDAMSNAEITAALERLAALGMLPEQDD